MKIAERFGQPPQDVAAWPPDWIAVTCTAMAAENGAAAEIAERNARRARMHQMSGGR